ncbi:uncharacterized protein SPPG_08625 [Spizellomyces punctatus DAOM BR117]|uniref:Cyclic nucleotide-binding domain-containing protein n=1 Tax=Spizellomyces punctatus (strain DAOM BR117) TaxID=645134 RepID=A0A0L0H3I5_SPIPD|nr:uncharacterized protein SPPG_08625 [Spizellomyces punctatus DAOM BR117]KNC96030.1 hypothetical protein SPPG_08625 [Spizellomyces punctatus DAOM BR117]|eukprot:XP_016604070.1 hypothetical protein SPPG_08625 [Spizellomyces punctatus DAOM BR117]
MLPQLVLPDRKPVPTPSKSVPLSIPRLAVTTTGGLTQAKQWVQNAQAWSLGSEETSQDEKNQEPIITTTSSTPRRYRQRSVSDGQEVTRVKTSLWSIETNGTTPTTTHGPKQDTLSVTSDKPRRASLAFGEGESIGRRVQQRQRTRSQSPFDVNKELRMETSSTTITRGSQSPLDSTGSLGSRFFDPLKRIRKGSIVSSSTTAEEDEEEQEQELSSNGSLLTDNGSPRTSIQRRRMSTSDESKLCPTPPDSSPRTDPRRRRASLSSGDSTEFRRIMKNRGMGNLDVDQVLQGKFDAKPELLLSKLQQAMTPKQLNVKTLDGEGTDQLTPIKDSASFGPVRRNRRMSITHFEEKDIKAVTNANSLPTTRQTAAQRWSFAITSVKKLLLSTLLFRRNNTDSETTSASNMLAAITQTEGVLAGCRLERLLETPSLQRSQTQERALDIVLCHMNGYARFPPGVRKRLSRAITLVSVPPHKLVIKSAYQPLFVYFLLSGICIATNESGTTTYKPGDLFGEFPITAPQCVRTCTVETVTACTLVSVPRDDYIRALTEEGGEEEESMEGFVRSCKGFEGAAEDVVNRVAGTGNVVRYEAGSVVVPPDERKMVCFLVRGRCRAMRVVPFVEWSAAVDGHVSLDISAANHKTTTTTTMTGQRRGQGTLSAFRRNSATVVSPYIPGSAPLDHKETLVHETLVLGDLEPKSYFPPLRLLRSEATDMRIQHVSATKIELLRTAVVGQYDPSHSESMAETASQAFERETFAAGFGITVTALTPVEVLCFPKVVFLQIVDVATLKSLVDPINEGVLGIPVHELQVKYLETLAWDEHRKSIVAEYSSEKR